MLSKRIICSQGDITESDADAIVNAANNHLWMGSGVAGAIKRKGGEQIEKEAVAKGPIPVGEAVATTGGKLKARYVIHAAAMGQDLRTDRTKIANATRNAMLRAEEMGLSSIDFPALGTGVGGFPASDAARVMVAEAREFLKKSKTVKDVGFVLFDDATFEIFNHEINSTNPEV